MKRGNNKNNQDQPDTTAWMVTFGDLLMLLLTFFVLLLSMSSMDLRALTTMFSIFRGAIGPLELADVKRVKSEFKMIAQGAGGPMEIPDLDKISILKDRYRQLVEDQIELDVNKLELLEDMFEMGDDPEENEILEGLKEIVSFSQDERGLIIALQGTVMFDPGEAEIKPTVFPLLDWIAEILDPIPNDILIMGHAGDEPIGKGRYRSYWDLSLYRALSVHNYLVEKKGLDPAQFGVGGYGDLRPQFPDDTQEGRQKNRRVEVVIKKRQKTKE